MKQRTKRKRGQSAQSKRLALAESKRIDLDQSGLVVDADNSVLVGANMDIENSPLPLIANPLPTMENEIRSPHVPREPVLQCPTLFKRAIRKLFGSAGRVAVEGAQPDSTERAEVVVLDAGNQGMSTRITDVDRAHMQAFPQEHKAVVMEKIMSVKPLQTVVHQGGNHFEKAVLNMHRESYELIDLQPHETAFTTLWYRKNRSFLGKKADVTMLLWEDGEVSDSTTIMTWQIESA
jgi:hypothetical protein